MLAAVHGVTRKAGLDPPYRAYTYRLRFPGQLYDSETGLYYNYHRHYEPDTGTYTQPDPIGLSGGINAYAYVNGNPVNLVDPLGLTQRDIDVARVIAMQSQSDLVFPDHYVVTDLGTTEDGGEVVGNTLPGVGTQLDDKYLKKLNNSEAAELLDTIIHEAVHNTLDPNDPLQKDGDRSGYPYDEAKKIEQQMNLLKS